MATTKYNNYPIKTITNTLKILETNSVSETSRITGVKRPTLYYWIKKYKVNPLKVPLGRHRKTEIVNQSR